MTEQEHKICPVCGKDACIETCLGDTCSQECARTLVIVEVGRELLKLLRVLAYPVYYSTPEGGVTPIPPSHLEAMKHGMGGGATWDEGQGRYVPVEEAEPAPHPTKTFLPPEPPLGKECRAFSWGDVPWGTGPKPGWWDKADY